MTALPPMLISILQPCLQFKASHVEVSDESVVIFKGEKEIGRGESPDGGCARFTELMMALSGEIDGGQRRAEFQTPDGKLYAKVETEANLVRLVFAVDSPAIIAGRFNELLAYAAREGAQKVAFTPDGVPMWKGEEMIGVGEIDGAQMPGFIAHARELANMEEGNDKGTAFLLGANVLLNIEIVERGGRQGLVIGLG